MQFLPLIKNCPCWKIYKCSQCWVSRRFIEPVAIIYPRQLHCCSIWMCGYEATPLHMFCLFDVWWSNRNAHKRIMDDKSMAFLYGYSLLGIYTMHFVCNGFEYDTVSLTFWHQGMALNFGESWNFLLFIYYKELTGLIDKSQRNW